MGCLLLRIRGWLKTWPDTLNDVWDAGKDCIHVLQGRHGSAMQAFQKALHGVTLPWAYLSLSGNHPDCKAMGGFLARLLTHASMQSLLMGATMQSEHDVLPPYTAV